MSSDIDNIDELIPGISLDLKEKFVSFHNLILQYNLKLNLVGKGTLDRMGVKHFYDCYQGLYYCRKHLNPDIEIFDFGSGNGFPGIIAALLFRTTQVIMVERDLRKAEFLKIAASHLELDNIETYSHSVNDLGEGHCQQIISRAMAPLPKFLLETRRCTQVGGMALLFKSESWSTEFGAIPAQVFEHWEVEPLEAYELPNNEGKRIILKCNRI